MSGAPSAKRQRTTGLNSSTAAAAKPNGRAAAATVSFDGYLSKVWNILNVKYMRLSCSKQFEKGFDAAHQVLDCITAVGKATPDHSSFSTKQNALVTLRKIGSCITESGGELGREVKKVFQCETGLEETMLRIARSMAVEERNLLMTQGFSDDLVKFEREAAGYGLFEEVKEVRLALLSKKKFSGGENEEDEEDEDDDEVSESESQDENGETGEDEDEDSDGEEEEESEVEESEEEESEEDSSV